MMIHRRKARRPDGFQIMLALICLVIIFITLLPFAHVIAISLSSAESILRGEINLWPKGVNLQAYRQVLSSGAFMRSFFYTIGLTALYVVIAMMLTTLCAYPLSKPWLKGRGVIMTAIAFVMYFDAGIIPNYLVIKNLGLINTLWALVLPIGMSAFNMVIMKNFFASLDANIFEAAAIDGCNEWRTLTLIVLPLSKAVLATLVLFYAVTRWNSVTDAIFYITTPSLNPLQAVLKEIILSESAAQMDVGQTYANKQTITESVRAASVVLAMLPILCLYPLAQRYFITGIMLGSVKG